MLGEFFIQTCQPLRELRGAVCGTENSDFQVRSRTAVGQEQLSKADACCFCTERDLTQSCTGFQRASGSEQYSRNGRMIQNRGSLIGEKGNDDSIGLFFQRRGDLVCFIVFGGADDGQ